MVPRVTDENGCDPYRDRHDVHLADRRRHGRGRPPPTMDPALYRRRSFRQPVIEPVRLPSADSREGLEGFRVCVPGRGAVGDVAAVNRTPEGLVVVVRSGDSRRHRLFRTVGWSHVESVSLSEETLMLTNEGASALERAPIRAAMPLFADDETLVRFVPTARGSIIEAGSRSPEASPVRIIAAVLTGMFGMLSLLTASALAGASSARPAWFFLGSALVLIAVAAIVFASQFFRRSA
jgi:hypothetical protein